MHIELMPLCQFARAGFVRGAADGIDPDRKLVYLRGRPPISYDVLSIDIVTLLSSTFISSFFV